MCAVNELLWLERFLTSFLLFSQSQLDLILLKWILFDPSERDVHFDVWIVRNGRWLVKMHGFGYSNKCEKWNKIVRNFIIANGVDLYIFGLRLEVTRCRMSHFGDSGKVNKWLPRKRKLHYWWGILLGIRNHKYGTLRLDGNIFKKSAIANCVDWHQVRTSNFCR